MLRSGMSGFVNDVALTEGVVGRRVAAWVIDALLMGAVLAVLETALWIAGFITFGLGWFLISGLWVVPLAYVVVFVASQLQATPGQALCGLRVVRDADLGPPEPAQATLYALGYAVTMWAGVIWLIAAFFTRRARCLHDIVSGLTVVRGNALGPAGARAWSMAGGTARP